MFRNPTTDLIIVLVIVLLFLGPKRLPGLGRSLGQGMREFKDSITGDSKHDEADKPELTQSSTTSEPLSRQGSEPVVAPDRSSTEVGSERQS
jgi:sec-independent protein translocase protein TatA